MQVQLSSPLVLAAALTGALGLWVGQQAGADSLTPQVVEALLLGPMDETRSGRQLRWLAESGDEHVARWAQGELRLLEKVVRPPATDSWFGAELSTLEPNVPRGTQRSTAGKLDPPPTLPVAWSVSQAVALGSFEQPPLTERTGAPVPKPAVVSLAQTPAAVVQPVPVVVYRAPEAEPPEAPVEQTVLEPVVVPEPTASSVEVVEPAPVVVPWDTVDESVEDRDVPDPLPPRATGRAQSAQALVYGDLDLEHVQQAVLARVPRWQACYDDALVRMPHAQGTLEIAFSVTAGHVTGISVVDPVGDPPLTRCVTQVAGMLRMDGEGEVVLPLVFTLDDLDGSVQP